jgi:hypothetical protein
MKVTQHVTCLLYALPNYNQDPELNISVAFTWVGQSINKELFLIFAYTVNSTGLTFLKAPHAVKCTSQIALSYLLAFSDKTLMVGLPTYCYRTRQNTTDRMLLEVYKTLKY